MALSIKRIGPGEEALLELLARDDADFDLDDRGRALPPLSASAARRYLSNPSVLHWVAWDGSNVSGFLYCCLVPLRSEPGQELLLYEIGVRRAARRQGVGRALLQHMEAWMRSQGVSEVWVCADNQVAVDFYRGCGFHDDQPQPLYLTRELELASDHSRATLHSIE